MVLFIKPANIAPGVYTGHDTGASLSAECISLNGKYIKIFFTETTRSIASIFSMQHCYVELNINPANHAPGVKNGSSPESLAPIDL